MVAVTDKINKLMRTLFLPYLLPAAVFSVTGFKSARGHGKPPSLARRGDGCLHCDGRQDRVLKINSGFLPFFIWGETKACLHKGLFKPAARFCGGSAI